jgi:hypothetical protein
MVSEALFETLKIKIGEAAAKKLLGIDKQQGNPKYTFGMPFTGGKLQINPMRMIANQGIKSIMSGGGSGIMGALPLIGGSLALGYARNPLRPGSMNYNPELRGQLDYLSSNNMIDRNNSMNALRYNKDSILRGQNVVSLFGTNDYGKQLQKYRDKYKDTMPKERLEKLDREIFDQITDDFDQTDKFIAQQTPATPKKPNTYFQPNERDGGDTPSPSRNSQGMTSAQHSAFRMARGGIASL